MTKSTEGKLKLELALTSFCSIVEATPMHMQCTKSTDFSPTAKHLVCPIGLPDDNFKAVEWLINQVFKFSGCL